MSTHSCYSNGVCESLCITNRFKGNVGSFTFCFLQNHLRQIRLERIDELVGTNLFCQVEPGFIYIDRDNFGGAQQPGSL